MTEFLLWTLAFQTLIIMGWGMLHRERIIQFPFLAAAVVFGWLFPQLWGLAERPLLPEGGLEMTIVMAILCLGAAWLGYEYNRRPARLFSWDFSRRRLMASAIMMSGLGGFCFYQISQLAVAVTPETGGQWTGIITVYAFLSKLLGFGMAIALILYLRKQTWPSLLVVLFGLTIYLERILIQGRRGIMVELTMMLLLALWFYRGFLPSRSVMVGVVFLGALVINSIGDYRQVMLGEDRSTWSGAGASEISEIDFLGNLKRLATGEAANHELTNTVMDIAAADRSQRFDFGLSLWNEFIHRFVPGQWVGRDLKRSLMIDFDDQAASLFGHEAFIGTTHTGLSDAFRSFWFFGAIKFFLIGLIMSRWYLAAVRGHLVAQLIVILAITPSLHAITHQTSWFFIFFLQLVVFLIPFLFFARSRSERKPGGITALVPYRAIGNQRSKQFEHH